jgi:hypothetical protein
MKSFETRHQFKVRHQFYGLDGPGSKRGTVKIFLHNVQTSSDGAYPASYPVGTGGDFPGFKAAGP